jgi:hypothetical protein
MKFFCYIQYFFNRYMQYNYWMYIIVYCL